MKMTQKSANWLIKAAVSGTQTTEIYGSDNIVDPSQEFFQYLQHGPGLLNHLTGRARWMPFNVNTAIPTSAVTAAVSAESASIGVSAYGMTFGALQPTKAGGIIVVSNEAIRANPNKTINQVWADLRNAVVLASDAKTLAIAKAAVTPGSGGASLAADVRTLLTAVCKSAVSDFVLVVSPARAAKICTLTDTAGVPLYPDMTPGGGIVHGVSVFVTAGQSDTELTMIDCTGLGYNDLSCDVLQARDAMIALDSAPAGDSQVPTGETTAMVSLFQADCSAFRAVRHFGVKVVRSSSVHVLTSISW